MFKIDKTLVENMNVNKSFIVISNPEICPKPAPSVPKIDISDVTDEKLPPEVKHKAQQILATAKAQADDMMQKAAEEADKIKAQAHAEGLSQGMEDAEERIAYQIESEVMSVRALLDQLYAFKQEFKADLEDSILDLSVDIAEKIVNIRLEKDDIVYVGIVKKAVEQLMSDEKFVLKVGHKEYERFFKDEVKWLKAGVDCGPFKVVCDPDMKPGDCVVESDSKIINAGVGMQLKKVHSALAGRAE